MSNVAKRFGAITLGGGDITQKFDALYIGGAGNVTIKQGTDDIVFVSVPAGSILPVKGDIIDDTLTTASNIVWLVW